MLGQGHDSAPGLDIMLLKQHLLSVSGQAANPARQHPQYQPSPVAVSSPEIG